MLGELLNDGQCIERLLACVGLVVEHHHDGFEHFLALNLSINVGHERQDVVKHCKNLRFRDGSCLLLFGILPDLLSSEP